MLFVDDSKSLDLLVDKRVFKDLFPGVPLVGTFPHKGAQGTITDWKRIQSEFESTQEVHNTSFMLFCQYCGDVSFNDA